MNQERDNQARIPVGMRPGERQLQSASLRVSLSDSVPVHMREGVREISHVFVPATDRRQHLATALLNFVCQEADANRITLLLKVGSYDDGGPNDAQLRIWYEQFGFVELQDSPEGLLMARRVHVPERKRVHLVARAVREALH